MKFGKELVGAATPLLVLTVLSGDELHGYEIVHRIEEISQGAFERNEGAIYPVLHKMEREGLVEGHWAKNDATGKQRRVYALTSDGRGELRRSRREWDAYTRAVGRVLEVCHA